jgi:hypothetical protein
MFMGKQIEVLVEVLDWISMLFFSNLFFWLFTRYLWRATPATISLDESPTIIKLVMIYSFFWKVNSLKSPSSWLIWLSCWEVSSYIGRVTKSLNIYFFHYVWSFGNFFSYLCLAEITVTLFLMISKVFGASYSEE